MMKRLLYILLLALVVASCTDKLIENTDGELIPTKYAKGFEIFKIEEGYILKVPSRFEGDESTTQNYLLSSNSEYESNNNVIIHIPVMNVVCLSTTHCAFVSQLNKSQTIKGVGGADYIFNDQIRSRILNNEIADIGYDNQINIEKVIAMNPDVVFAYGIDNSSIASFQKLSEIGIPVVYVGDFLETTPLGRTEWLKFFGCFYDNLHYADEYFDSVENNYNTTKLEIEKSKVTKPDILLNMPWKGTWWVPGGKSYMANFINDAGGNYFMSEDSSTESIPLSIEEVFLTAKDADIWLNPNSADNKRQILNNDERLSEFEPINNQIFNNNKRINKFGGNDFYESGILHPDIILKDLNTIFSLEEIDPSDLYYYKEIK